MPNNILPPILNLMDPQLPQTTIIKPDAKTSGGLFNIKKVILILGVVVLLVIAIAAAYYLFMAKPKPAAPEEKVLPPITGAVFILSADPLESTVGNQIKVSVLIKSDLDTANLFVAKLKFPSDLLQAERIDLRSESTASGFIKNWFISNWVENTIDNNTGSVSLVGGVPNPGFQTQPESSGSAMADVIFEAIASGQAKITFDDTSAIYRNSDNINILVDKKDITVKILGEKPVSSDLVVLPTEEVTASPSLTPTLTLTPTPSDPFEGDANKDGKTDLADLSFFLTVWGKSGFEIPEADLNKDGVINAFDYSNLIKILKDSGQIQ